MPASTFPKRHASFHSPREVPLPSPPRDREQPTEQEGSWLDRFSSASLPLPSQIPYFTLPKANEQPPESSESPSPPRPTSPPPFRAPQPPRCSTYVPPTPTAMRSRPSSSSSSTSTSPSLAPASSSQPPEAPTILEDEPHSRSRGPCEVFLNNNAQPPPDSWIHIDTLPAEYRLYVRLPGFTREGITLATKRRRILHLVADKWDRDGGHFERKIAFGHDADLMQVRAEFDGDMLRVYVPRRQSVFSWCGNGVRSNIAYSRA